MVKLLSALAVISTAFFVAWTRYRLQQWERSIDRLEDQLLSPSSFLLHVHEHDEQQQQQQDQSWEDLPPVVQKYFERVLPSHHQNSNSNSKDTMMMIRSLRMEQQGQFLLEGQRWVLFTATQVLSAGRNSPGFYWDASIALFQERSWYPPRWPMVQVCDAWVGSSTNSGSTSSIAHIMKASSLNGVWPLQGGPPSKTSSSSAPAPELELEPEPAPTTTTTADHPTTTSNNNSNNTPNQQSLMSNMLVQGQVLRWLAEAVLIPTVLLPEQGLVTWHAFVDLDRSASKNSDDDDEADDNSSNKAVLSYVGGGGGGGDDSSNNKIIVTFDANTGWVTQVDCERPMWRQQKQDFVLRHWQGHLYDYQEQHLLHHPHGGGGGGGGGDDASSSSSSSSSSIWVPTRMECGWMRSEEDDDDEDDDNQTKNNNPRLELYFKGENKVLEYTTTTVTANKNSNNNKNKVKKEEEEEEENTAAAAATVAES